MITTHVLDLALGRPAAGVTVLLEVRQGSQWAPVARGVTDANGRVNSLAEGRSLGIGAYRLTFDIATYHREHGTAAPFFEEAKIVFNVDDASEHYHVPLLLSPYGYSTYRGS
jgi:5-hydroxyisourate hydrolase